jgi:HTH-type transcriptional regulator/antitoxin HipB
LVFEICGKPMEKDGINCQWETPKPIFSHRNLNAKTIRQSVFAPLLKQEKEHAGFPAICRPQKTWLHRTEPRNRPRGTESSGAQTSSIGMVAELVKESRKKAHLTQQQLADKLNVKRTYISKIERASSDVRISTLRKIIETGLGGKLNISVEL